MAWVGDLVFTVGAGTLLRFTTHIPERQATVLRDIREVAPTIYLAAPRAWDNMLTRIQIGMADSTPFKRRLYDYLCRARSSASANGLPANRRARRNGSLPF